MPHHCKDSEHGVGRGDALASMMVVRLSFVALDSGDADEFSFGKAGGSACSRGLCPCEQGKVAVAS
ncbi:MULTISPECIES: hypothetical protein [unclassified Mesorhizobium]|uniref:hypothetical protein n=1 Tax=unclassified Mesorhizobium TaxID=325217 RepID=UPI000BAF9866|nr:MULTISPECIES: hypothetical protein [unclassified Mesorhizobium]PBC20396.1 hypothetical protein CK226_22815 [Mesorhizobium sp. WSM4311]TRC93040.1 hypothetical protein FJV82_31495 [Mesorhizobium sp. WSM4305]